jgi:hypothetical protein
MPDDCHIAKRTILEISDDLDGSKDVKAVQFGFEGVRTNVPCAALRRAGAETLPYSRIGVVAPPHPGVQLNCRRALGLISVDCDSDALSVRPGHSFSGCCLGVLIAVLGAAVGSCLHYRPRPRCPS